MILHVDGKSGDRQLEEYIARAYMEIYERFKSPEFDKAFQDLLVDRFELFKRKQASYGSNNIAALGMKGVFVRIWDKVQRLRNLVWLDKPNTIDDESIEDTFGDLAVYSMMAIVLKRGEWPEYYERPLDSILTPELLKKMGLDLPEPKLEWVDLKSEGRL